MISHNDRERRLRHAVVVAIAASFFTTIVTGDPLRSFDCADAFEVVALATLWRCTATEDRDAAERVALAVDRLVARSFFGRDEFDGVEIQLCPLGGPLGFTPGAERIALDTGLRGASVDLLSEVLAHEMVHVRQARRLGRRAYRCAYVEAMAACGGCQDRDHPLEREAYSAQDRVRDALLDEALR